MLHTNIYNHSLLYFLTIQYFISITVFHCVCEMYQIGRVVSFQVDPEIVLRKRRVVKYRLLKKGSANDRPNYTLELRIIHVQK